MVPQTFLSLSFAFNEVIFPGRGERAYRCMRECSSLRPAARWSIGIQMNDVCEREVERTRTSFEVPRRSGRETWPLADSHDSSSKLLSPYILRLNQEFSPSEWWSELQG